MLSSHSRLFKIPNLKGQTEPYNSQNSVQNSCSINNCTFDCNGLKVATSIEPSSVLGPEYRYL